MKKKYWQSFGELNNTPAQQKEEQDEFKELLPLEDGEKILDTKTNRRDFLKYLGFSTAAATIAASCEMPVRKIIPYVNKPENLIPGIANYYATTYVQDGDVVPIVAKVRDGRPIKIEGNDLSPLTQGGTSARVQASVLDLYDTSRLRYPTANGKEVPSFEALDKMMMEEITKLNGAPIVLLTSTINSPTSKEIIHNFLQKHSGSRHVTYDAVSYSGMLLANEACYGIKALPSYQFNNAKVIVSLGADFLGTWLTPVEYAKQYAAGRKIDEKNPVMSKHYQFESHLSMTGANADERFTHRPSETGAVAIALYEALSGPRTFTITTGEGITDQKLKQVIEKVAKDLLSHKGESLVICGSNDVNIQIIVNAINNIIGSNSKTISWRNPAQYRQGIDTDMETLVTDMNAGKVGALMIIGANPLYEYYNSNAFKSGLSKLKLAVSFNPKLDETAEHCKYIIPTHHYLESWGDVEAQVGFYSFMQPTINPLFNTRQWQDSLLKWSGSTIDYATYIKEYWTKISGNVDAWNVVLQMGVRSPKLGIDINIPTFKGNITDALNKINNNKKGEKAELVLYQSVALGEGKQANNPWLHEMPDPITKATWDNYAMISVTMAKELGITLGDSYEVHPEKPVISITANNKTIELPVLVIPGMQANTIAVALGYGRSENIGKAAANVGQNVYQWASFNGTTVDYIIPNISYTKTDKQYKIAQTQTHNTYEGRTEVIKETSLATFKKEPNIFKEEREELVKDFAPKTGDYRKEATMYPDFEKPGIHWNMAIDLNSCTGCGACVVACNAENNIPVVGKMEVMRAHEMHWLRIDRYFVTDEQKPDDLVDVVFQPMLCQHCDNAPCENVCPVDATNHSSEGLNQMTYNRCIGTRYCANNCPYKVRRFNWADYMGADSFSHNQDELSDVTLMMNDELTRMVLNPDVTVRSRGVIEKCSFCAQRLQAAKLGAKKESQPLKDGEAKTACMQACPTNAIVFGNVKDKESHVHKMKEENPNRLFYVLEEIHTLPNVSYLAKVRNTDEILEEHKK